MAIKKKAHIKQQMARRSAPSMKNPLSIPKKVSIWQNDGFSIMKIQLQHNKNLTLQESASIALKESASIALKKLANIK